MERVCNMHVCLLSYLGDPNSEKHASVRETGNSQNLWWTSCSALSCHEHSWVAIAPSAQGPFWKAVPRSLCWPCMRGHAPPALVVTGVLLCLHRGEPRLSGFCCEGCQWAWLFISTERAMWRIRRMQWWRGSTSQTGQLLRTLRGCGQVNGMRYPCSSQVGTRCY